MTCKYCGNEEAQWPENYVKGCRMIEMDTGIEHTRERCDEQKITGPTKSRWIERICNCGTKIRYSRKHYNTITAVGKCEDCLR